MDNDSYIGSEAGSKALNLYAVVGSYLIIGSILWALWTYGGFMHRPMQGGWTIERMKEFGFWLLPWLMIALLTLVPWWRWSLLSCAVGYILFIFAGIFLLYVGWLSIVATHQLPNMPIVQVSTYVARAVWLLLNGRHKPLIALIRGH